MHCVLCSHLLAQHALGGHLLAGGGDDLLAVLSDGRVHHLVILLGTEVCRYVDISIISRCRYLPGGRPSWGSPPGGGCTLARALSGRRGQTPTPAGGRAAPEQRYLVELYIYMHLSRTNLRVGGRVSIGSCVRAGLGIPLGQLLGQLLI